MDPRLRGDDGKACRDDRQWYAEMTVGCAG